MAKTAIQLLLVEDNPADVLLLRQALARDAWAWFQVTVAERLSQGLAAWQSRPFDAVLLDLGLPDSQGLETFEAFQRQAAGAVVVLSGLLDEYLAVRAVQAGAQDYLVKGQAGWDSVPRAVRYAIERQQAQAARQASERRFRALIEQSADAVALLAADGLILYESAAATRVLGWLPEEMSGRNAFEFLHPEGLSAGRALFGQVLSQPHTPVTAELLYRHKDGGWRWVEATGTNLLDDPNVGAIVVNYRDITARKHAEVALRVSESRYRALFDDSPAAVWEEDFSDVQARFDQLRLAGVTDFAAYFAAHPDEVVALAAAVRVLAINQASVHMLGARDEAEVRRSLAVYFGPESYPVFQQELAALAHGQTSFRADIPVRNQAGEPRLLEISLRVLPGAEVTLERVLVAFIDLTERQQAQEEIRRLNAELEQRVAERTAELSRANADLKRMARAKDDFLASMSHELRTPLNAILTLTEALDEGVYGPLDERQSRPLRLVGESGQHLLALINDILDLAKIEAGKLELQIAPVEVEPLCQASLRLVKQQAHKKRLTATLDLAAEARLVRADARRLKQMLVNLLGNAVKFTPEGGQIGLEVRADTETGAAHFTVWDTGIGIAPEEARHLFQPFVQVDGGLDRQYGGTGLGLSLVQRMAELHGGSVGLVSAPGQGSRFTVSLPWDDTEARPAAEVPAAAPALTARRVLVVEDSPTVSEQLTRYLEAWGAQVSVDPTGAAVLEQVLAAPPDVILLDIHLPGRSGWQVLAQLRAEPRTRAIPVVVVAVSDERERGWALGVADYIVKPVSRARLREALEKALRPAPGLAQPRRRPVVLLAEDNLMMQTTYSDYLAAAGYEMRLAVTGREVLEQVQAAPPDIILMDVQMPEMDGLEAIQRLRADPATAVIPIIALTALAMPGDRERCLAAGADDYLTKPVRLTTLAQTVASHLRRGQA